MKRNSPGCSCCRCASIYCDAYDGIRIGFQALDYDTTYRYPFIGDHRGLSTGLDGLVRVDNKCHVYVYDASSGASGRKIRKLKDRSRSDKSPFIENESVVALYDASTLDTPETLGSFAVSKDGDVIVANFNTSSVPANSSSFLKKMNIDGDELWVANVLTLARMDLITDVEVDRHGFVYVAGSGVFLPRDSQGRSNCLAKFAPNGELMWATTTNQVPDGEFDTRGLLRDIAVTPSGDSIWASDGYSIYRFTAAGNQASRFEYIAPRGETNVLNQILVNDRGYCFARRDGEFGPSVLDNTRLIVMDNGGEVARFETAHGYYQNYSVRCDDDEDFVYVLAGDFEREFPIYLSKFNWRTGELIERSDPIQNVVTGGHVETRPGRAGAFGRLPDEF